MASTAIFDDGVLATEEKEGQSHMADGMMQDQSGVDVLTQYHPIGGSAG